LPPPTINAEPAAETPLGQCVTVVCRSPAAFEVFRLEKEGGALKPDVSKRTPHDTEARFSFTADKGTEGHYHCLYYRNRAWSGRSVTLDLVVTGENTSALPQDFSGTARRPDGALRWMLRAQRGWAEWDRPWGPPQSIDLSTEHVYILVGVSVALFLCLLLLALALLRGQRQKKRSSPDSRWEGTAQWWPQEVASRGSPGGWPLGFPSHSPSHPDSPWASLSQTPAAGSPQDVTYAQLDQRVLTQRTAGAAFPQSVEPTAEASTYASLARR
ncbi:LAIR1 protein, partial [Crocuta crocuta]